MSLATPTTQDVSDVIIAQLEAYLSQTIPVLPKAFSRVLAKALAGTFVLLYRYAGFIFLQLFVAYATMSETSVNGKVIRPLVEWGRLLGVGDPTAATRAELVLTVTVLTQTGTLAAGTHLVRTETGVTYQTLYPVDLDAATVSVAVRAVEDEDGDGGAGTIGNLQVGDEVSFMGPVPNVARVAVVDSQTVTGADAEEVETYRGRIKSRMQSPPQGGAYADFRAWGEEVAGIIHVYPYTSDSPGQIDLYCEASAETAEDDDGTPTDAQLSAVDTAVKYDASGAAKRRQANAAVNIYSITRTPFDVVVTGLDVSQASDDESTVKANLETALDEHLRTREPYIEGLSVLPRKNLITQGDVAGVVAGVVNAAGASVSSVALQEAEATTSMRVLAYGEKAKLGEVEYG